MAKPQPITTTAEPSPPPVTAVERRNEPVSSAQVKEPATVEKLESPVLEDEIVIKKTRSNSSSPSTGSQKSVTFADQVDSRDPPHVPLETQMSNASLLAAEAVRVAKEREMRSAMRQQADQADGESLGFFLKFSTRTFVCSRSNSNQPFARSIPLIFSISYAHIKTCSSNQIVQIYRSPNLSGRFLTSPWVCLLVSRTHQHNILEKG